MLTELCQTLRLLENCGCAKHTALYVNLCINRLRPILPNDLILYLHHGIFFLQYQVGNSTLGTQLWVDQNKSCLSTGKWIHIYHPSIVANADRAYGGCFHSFVSGRSWIARNPLIYLLINPSFHLVYTQRISALHSGKPQLVTIHPVPTSHT